MKTNFSPEQVKWASEHDWFVRGDLNQITCVERWSDGTENTIQHSSFQALRDWACY